MKLVDTLSGKISQTPPIWIMRQAGRYLPEFKELRKKAPQFMDFCRHADLVTEVTLQPLKRFDLDAAIIFSDILMVPHALGQKVHFESGVGPVLPPIASLRDFETLASAIDEKTIEPILEAIRAVRATLPPKKALIGFAGAPWTVMTYMIEGQGSKGKAHGQTLSLYFENPTLFKRLQERVVNATTAYLLAQAKAGVNVLKIFDSWAGSVPAPLHEDLICEPLRAVARRVKEAYPSIPLIIFPKGLSAHQLSSFKESVPCDALACDQLELPQTLATFLPKDLPIQTGPHPELLRAGGDLLRSAVEQTMTAFEGKPLIMNLSHGILPTTPIDNVHAFLGMVKDTAARKVA